ncbi:hypothetical protein [Marivita sp. GX14005]|uniref:hypothetical protein n=1 Tax=Marivita sp. GX14005 TaxID=2942276 RepID=UPI00201A1027|nr:hypothetical protein [Marivita sp. GX14005]MCL3882556.1 hypothetical protein [Marivita sp. GX14005]
MRAIRNTSASLRRLAAAVVLMSAFGAQQGAEAQVLSAQTGRAAKVDIVAAANDLSMQEAYPRSLFLYLKANPNYLSDPQFYVSLVSYLISTKLDNYCRDAFSNEFERRDFFTRSFEVMPQLQQVIAGKAITQRFEVSYKVDTGQYDFTTGQLPFTSIQSVGEQLGSTITAQQGQQCARQMLQGTEVDTSTFPWNFTVENEEGQRAGPAFPFTRTLQLSSNDARTLFETFGRQLYSIVGYRMQAANDGTHRTQVIPTDAQLFGLSDNAVVRVKTFAHPTLSQPSYLDISSELALQSEPLSLDATVRFEQDGFRAVANGTAQGRSTGVTVGATYPVSGSAAVGATSFIMRIAAPQLMTNVSGLRNNPGAQRFLTLFGGIDFNNVTASVAPVEGRAVVLEIDPSGEMRETGAFQFRGRFTAIEDAPEASAAASPEPNEEQQGDDAGSQDAEPPEGAASE